MLQSAEVVAVQLLDNHEVEVVDQALRVVAARAPADAQILRDLIDQLRQTNALLESTRPLRAPTAMGGEARNESTLIEHLITLDGLSGDLMLPLKANLSRTALLTKINFLRGFIKATTAVALGASTDGAGDVSRLIHDLNEELAQSIYTLLCEELFLALLRKPDVTVSSKRRVADQLIAIWDDSTLEIDDFAPLLESAWHARNRITSDFGCLVGATETFRLVCEDCSPEVLEFFARDDMSEQETAAFQEFLFNMTWEELGTLRGRMREEGKPTVSRSWASNVLGRPIDELEHSREVDAIALYRSYNRRQLAADFRQMSGAGGPLRTAEGYLMLHLLDGAAGL
ncbi:MAG: hypothetical protein R3B06_09585 [Kofleriaceae bacterium]